MRLSALLGAALWVALGWMPSFGQTGTPRAVLEIPHLYGRPGDTLTLPVTAREFEDVLGLQFSLTWDSTIIRPVGVQLSDQLPMTADDLSLSPPGYPQSCAVAWINPSADFTGYTLTAGDTLFSLRFIVVGPSGQSSPVRFASEPTDIEIFNSKGQVLRPLLYNGSITVGQQPGSAPPRIDSVSVSGAVCSDGSSLRLQAHVTSTSPVTYTWESPDGTVRTGNPIQNVPTGMYTLVVRDGSGQSGSLSLTATAPPPLEVFVRLLPGSCTQDVPTGRINLTVFGSGSYTYAWSTGDTIRDLAGLHPGSYQVTVTDRISGCRVVRSAELAGGARFISQAIITEAYCGGDIAGRVVLSVDSSGLSLPLRVQWETGDTTLAAALPPGVHAVTLTDARGCREQNQFAVPDRGQPFTVAKTDPTCVADDGRAAIRMQPLPFAYQVRWSNGATADSLSDLAAGQYTATIRLKSGECTVDTTLTLRRPPSPRVSFTESCEAVKDTARSRVQLTLDSATVAPYTFSWSDGMSQSGPTGPERLLTPGATYSVTITDNLGCHSVLELPLATCPPLGQAPTYRLTAEGGDYFPGDTLTVHLRADNFRNLTGLRLQLRIPAALRVIDFSSAMLPIDSVEHTPGQAQDDLIDIRYLPAAGTPLTWPDGSTLLTLRLLATAGGPAVIDFNRQGNTLFVEDLYDRRLTPIVPAAGLTLEVGRALSLAVEPGSSELQVGRATRLDLLARDIDRLGVLDFHLEWDTSALVLTEWLPTAGSLNGWQYDALDALNGRIDFTFTGTPELTLPADAELAMAAFVPKRTGEQVLHLIIDSLRQRNRALPADSLRVPLGTAVASGTPVVLRLPQVAIMPGSTFEVPVVVQMPAQVTYAHVELQYDTALLRLDSVLDVVAAAGIESTVQPGSGLIALDWRPRAGGSGAAGLPRAGQLARLRFQIKAQFDGTVIQILDAAGDATDLRFAADGTSANLPVVPYHGLVQVTTEPVVWPGDTDTNGLVNQYDLLPVGLAYGAEGPQRYNAFSGWIGQAAEAWEQATPASAVNYRHIDTNGDGAITAADTSAISGNWGRTIGNDSVQTNNPTGPTIDATALYVQTDTIRAANPLTFPVVLGNAELPAEGVYGLAFRLAFPAEAVQTGSVFITFADSWLGAPEELLTIYRITEGGFVDLAMTRRDRISRNGTGPIAFLHLQPTAATIAAGGALVFTISDARIINEREELIEAVTPPTSAVITSTREAAALRPLQVYPQPARDVARLTQGEWQVRLIDMYDTNGRQVRRYTDSNELPLKGIPAGVYMLRIQTSAGLAVRKLIIQE